MYIYYFIFILFLILYGYFDFENLNKYTTGRAILWQNAISLISDNLFFGISMKEFYDNTFLFASSLSTKLNFDYKENAVEILAGGAHQMFLNWFLNYGVISFLMYIVFISYNWSLIKKTGFIITKVYIYLPFVFILLRGFAESSGIIGSSRGAYEFLIDIYLGYIMALVVKSKLYIEKSKIII
ncbi:hypothetical protein FACS189426_20910 [Bacteroidia bacterium]|nr:hypothetical protein FACS189426_20910 [Bacteroidia bacterium]GHV70287.1 hypothetical protein FACS189420_0750 [Bacteroidia bacterium]